MLIPTCSSFELASNIGCSGRLPGVGVPGVSGNCTNPVPCLGVLSVTISSLGSHLRGGVIGGVGSGCVICHDTLKCLLLLYSTAAAPAGSSTNQKRARAFDQSNYRSLFHPVLLEQNESERSHVAVQLVLAAREAR